VVAARAGSIPEVAGDAALLVDPGDAPMLAGALNRVITDNATRTDLVAAGRDRLGRFSWSHTARALAACYRQLARRGR
jgi:glycosyltransferase involved in cell wall biosynthesis